MAAIERSSEPYLNLLSQQGEELNFFQAIRLLERAVSDIDKVRFRAVNSQAFRPNFIAGIKHQIGESKVEVKVNGFSLVGMQGPLPQSFSDLLQYSEIKGASGIEDPNHFLDIFHDRLVSLLYTIKKRFNPLLFNQAQSDHELYSLFSSICGFEQLNIFDHLPMEREELATMAPIIANRRLDHSLLRNVLQQSFDCEVKIHPNQGAWRTLPSGFQCKLGADKSALSSAQQQGLGNGIGLGTKYWDNQAAIGLDISVSSIDAMIALLPIQQATPNSQYNKLKNLVTFLADAKYQFNVTLLLDWQKVPVSKLMSAQGDKAQLRLGQTSWLKSSTSPSHESLLCPEFIITPGFSSDEQGAAA